MARLAGRSGDKTAIHPRDPERLAKPKPVIRWAAQRLSRLSRMLDSPERQLRRHEAGIEAVWLRPCRLPITTNSSRAHQWPGTTARTESGRRQPQSLRRRQRAEIVILRWRLPPTERPFDGPD